MKKDYSDTLNIKHRNISGLHASENMLGHIHNQQHLKTSQNAEKTVTSTTVGTNYETDSFSGHTQMVTKRYGISNESYGETDRTSQMSV